ncbi:MAG: Helix-turn-helix domain [Actinomycetota bacterium]|jgi:predicted DNA-binding transcriptional regulator AlpA
MSAIASRVLLTAKQLAQRWQVTPEWIYRNRIELEIPTMTIGGNVRFALDDIEAYENAHRN